MLSVFDKIGVCVIGCKRYFVDSGNNIIPIEKYDQEADGLTLLEFDDGDVLLFYGQVEEDRITVKKTDDKLLLEDGIKPLDFSENEFWIERLNQPVTRIEELSFRKNIPPYGFKFYLKNGLNFSIEYHWETEFDSETTVIRSSP